MQVLESKMKKGFYSPSFVVPKNGGVGMRPILYLRALNRIIVPSTAQTPAGNYYALRKEQACWNCPLRLREGFPVGTVTPSRSISVGLGRHVQIVQHQRSVEQQRPPPHELVGDGGGATGAETPPEGGGVYQPFRAAGSHERFCYNPRRPLQAM